MSEDRRLRVLRAIVQDYVQTSEPVGSKALLERHHLGVSAATVRNDMAALEEEGLIQGYHARINARELGFEVQVFAMVGLSSQAERDLSAFEARCRAWSLVRECHMLNGEIDFILKCVAPDLSTFQRFLTDQLTAADNVASVKTSLVIRCAKDEPGVPFELVEGR